MATLLSLPEELLEMIAAKMANSLLRYEESWGPAATACKRLHNLQLPGEFAEAEGLQSLPWLMPRLKHAKALRIYTTYGTNESLTTIRPLHETARLLHSASSYVSKLSVLVLKMWSGNDQLGQLLAAWISELLISSSSLHTLDFEVDKVPCPPVLRHLPLKHLVLKVRTVCELPDVLEDLSHCQLLESLSIITYQGSSSNIFPELPRIDLRAATRLRHVKLTGFIPGASQALALPPGCALRLHSSSKSIWLWSRRGVAGRDAVSVLFVWYTRPSQREKVRPVPYAWPEGLESFPALKHLRLECLHMSRVLNLAVFAHIPCLKICSRFDLAVDVPEALCWQLLELECRCNFRVSVPSLRSIIRSVSVFAFTLPSDRMQPVEQLVEACSFADIALHEQQHYGQAGALPVDMDQAHTYWQMTKLSNDKQYVRGVYSDSAVLTGVWPPDPVESATGLLKKVS